MVPSADGGADVWLSTARLAGVRDLAAEDLYVSVGAGTRLAELHRSLEPHGVMLPLASPWPDASVGGAVACNLNAPCRLRYGGVRDLTLSVTAALADGRVIRAGRPLVKNVAGYDLTKAFVGSFGSLGVVTEVTLKLVPEPRVRRTLALDVEDLVTGWRLAQEALRLALLASAIVLGPRNGSSHSGYRLVVTVEGDERGVEVELGSLRDRLVACGSREPREVEESGTQAWQRFLRGCAGGGVGVRAGVPVKEIGRYLETGPNGDETTPWFVDCGAGSIYAVSAEAPERVLAWLAGLRERAVPLGGYAAILDASAALGSIRDRWGDAPEAFDVMRRLKDSWDPRGILNPGAFLFD